MSSRLHLACGSDCLLRLFHCFLSVVQGKLNETFLAVKLPELDTDFDIDTSSVEEAVQALQINIHPDRE